ncbi:hypothetical protein Tco_0364701 [Tanacetum coccineum]
MVDRRRMKKKWMNNLFSCHNPFESFTLVERVVRMSLSLFLELSCFLILMILAFKEFSLTGVSSSSVGSSNTYVFDLHACSVLINGTSKAGQHVDTSSIHIESRKSPTAVLFDDDTGRISIRHCEYLRVSL